MLDRNQLLAKYRGYNVPWGPIGEPVFKRTYSHIKGDGRKETWPEAVIRTVIGNAKLAIRSAKAGEPPALSDHEVIEHLIRHGLLEEGEVEKLVELLLPFGSLPAGRHLNASGVEGRQFLFNCHAAGWDYDEPWAHFTFLFDSLMQGGGVGSNYSNRYLEKLPKINTGIDLHIVCREDHPNLEEFYQLLTATTQKPLPVPYGRRLELGEDHDTFVVPDSREGWVECVERIMKLAWSSQGTYGREAKLILDVSNIRARGEPLKTSGGIACGPGPLVAMLTDFTRHLNGCYDRKLTSLDAMILDHTVSACVVAGGKRRSSRMAVKSWMDEDIFEFINCKREDGAHWTTNISVETNDDFEAAYRWTPEAQAKMPPFLHEQARNVMRAVTLGFRSNGEPGFWNRSLSMKGERDPGAMFCPNPCGEIGLHMWENCNLGHVNMEYFANKPPTQMYEAFRLMTRWLMRATFGDIPDKRQREVVDKNRRIGVGFFGYHGFTSLRGIKYSQSWDNDEVVKTLSVARVYVDTEAELYAKILGIPVPMKTTTIAPTGTLSALTGTSAGDQAIYAPWYNRLVRYSTMDPELAVKKLEGYEVFTDPDAKNTDIVVYWCEDPLVTKVRANGIDPDVIEAQDEISFADSLAVQAMLQEVWANNSISHTINLPLEKMGTEEEMEEMLMSFHSRLKGTTIFPDKSRRNAPLQRLTREQFEKHAGRKEISMVEVECVGGCPVK
jgi:adenosylcobalamin-dependent ribonucleoside-triphosphate reductase